MISKLEWTYCSFSISMKATKHAPNQHAQ